MTSVQQVLSDFRRRENAARRAIAESLCALSKARLHCNACHREQILTVESSLEYLADGWPNCCGEEMSIRTGDPEC